MQTWKVGVRKKSKMLGEVTGVYMHGQPTAQKGGRLPTAYIHLVGKLDSATHVAGLRAIHSSPILIILFSSGTVVDSDMLSLPRCFEMFIY